MERNFQVRAAQRTYEVNFGPVNLGQLVRKIDSKHVIAVIDSNLQNILSQQIEELKAIGTNIIYLEATEKSKELDSVGKTATALLDAGLTRSHTLLAVGGGITQDIVAFCASICLRGVDWMFVPTTLLAQADSCIGSKTSINLGRRKNAVGTYWPPVSIFIDPFFLRSLDEESLRAGLGEMFKVHAIKGPEEFDSLSKNYEDVFENEQQMLTAIYNSLIFKKEIIEADERDSQVRLVMNYGHTFGHAIEVSSDYQIQHGIAVTLGCDVANYVAWKIGLTSEDHYHRMHGALMRNAGKSCNLKLDLNTYEQAIKSDKKHGAKNFTFILPDTGGHMKVVEVAKDDQIIELSKGYIRHGYSN